MLRNPVRPLQFQRGPGRVVHATGDQRRRGWAAATALLGTALTVLTLVLRHGRVGAPASGKVQVLQAAEVRPHSRREVGKCCCDPATQLACGAAAGRQQDRPEQHVDRGSRLRVLRHVLFPAITAWSRSTASSPTRSRSSSRSAPCRASCEQAAALIASQAKAVASGTTGVLGWGAALGIVFALWTAASGVKALFTALNIAYGEEEKRGVIRFNFDALLFTLLMIVGVIVGLT